MKNFAKVLQVVVLSTAAAASHAALLIGVVGGAQAGRGAADAGATSPNDVLGNKQGWYGANLIVTGNETLAFEYVGSEAHFTNRFIVGSNVIYNHQASSFTQSFSTSGSPEWLGFRFESDSSAGTSTVNNGTNTLPSFLGGSSVGQPSFWVGYEAGYGGSISSILVVLDDGGSNPDYDFDDQVIRITGFSSTGLTTVPLPSAFGLFGSALGLLAIRGRRRHA